MCNFVLNSINFNILIVKNFVKKRNQNNQVFWYTSIAKRTTEPTPAPILEFLDFLLSIKLAKTLIQNLNLKKRILALQ